MTAPISQIATTVTPLLFGKRKLVASAIATQYSGTDTELDVKGTHGTA